MYPLTNRHLANVTPTIRRNEPYEVSGIEFNRFFDLFKKILFQVSEGGPVHGGYRSDFRAVPGCAELGLQPPGGRAKGGSTDTTTQIRAIVHRRIWTNEGLLDAVETVQNGKMGINAGIPVLRLMQMEEKTVITQTKL
ncbi:unnamed protein product [Heterotrigona itama]|uniref:Uncharacterized protein n=1 Tax=Heterotrigona itama TaxID=395501 RepID=A0A6V7GTQ2_9HYME|nr:unnamed protein product [Heterotrigona itama]